jgi:hypothetical protein
MVGEHIRALRRGRWMHAIDCGDETVIHLADDGSPSVVRRSYRPEFVSGAEMVEVVRHRERTFPADEVVARAYSRIADPALAAMFGDSESFAEWCATGRLAAATGPTAAGVAAAARAPAQPARKATKRPRAAAGRKAKRPASKTSARAAAPGGAQKKAAAVGRSASRARPARSPAGSSAKKTAPRGSARKPAAGTGRKARKRR